MAPEYPLLPLAAEGGHHLGSWQLAVVAWLFVAWILLVAAVLERWEEHIHA